MTTKVINIENIKIGGGNPFVLIAGPCVIENRDLILSTAESIKNISEGLNIPFIFKSSFKKANRTSINSFSGLDENEAIDILKAVKNNLSLPVITDIHSPHDIDLVSPVADILQIPAFLCRQTELLFAAGQSGRIVNIKKGQFLAPEDIKHAIDKIKSTGNMNILVTERGTTFGYHNLVVDMRSLVIMRKFGCPVVMDATHSVQIPGEGAISGGTPEFIPPLARAAAAVGIDCLFLEVHPEPERALSDSKSQFPLHKLEDLLRQIQKIDSVIKNATL